MMQALRKQAKGFLAFILFGLLILSFAVWGIQDIFSPVSGRTVVIEVGDTEIPAELVYRDVQREMQALRQRSGISLDLEQAMQFGLVNQVLSRLVGTALLDQGTREMGVAVSDKLVSDAVLNDRNFHNQFGKFERARYSQLLRSQGLSERGYEEILRGDLARQQLASGISASQTVPKSMAHAIYSHRREQRVAEIVFIANDNVTGVPAPSNSDLVAFHKENEARFMAPEYRQVIAVIIRPEDLAADIEVGNEQLREAYRDRLDEFETPEQRTVEQLLFADADKARDAHGRIAGGEDYAAVGKDILGGDPLPLGSIAKADLPIQALADAAFSLQPGGVSAPVETGLGWHILRVTKIEEGRTKSFDEAREALAKSIASELAADAAIQMGEDLDKEVGSGTGIDEAAGRLNLTVTRIEAMDARGRDPDGKEIAAIPAGSGFVSQAFELAEGEDGLLSDAADGAYFILRVDAVTRAAVRPLASVRTKVADAWSAERRAEAARKKAEALADKLNVGGTLADLARAERLSTRTTDPFTRDGEGAGENVSTAAVEKLFRIREGESAWAETKDGYVVGVLKEINKANPLGDSAGVAKVTEGLRRAVASDLVAQFSAALRDRYPVEVDQAAIEDLFTRR